MTLESLFIHAQVNTYTEHAFFRRAVLRPPFLLVEATPDAIRFIERHYLPKFRELISDLEIRPHPPKTLEPVKATKYPKSIKPGPWRDRLDGLDS